MDRLLRAGGAVSRHALPRGPRDVGRKLAALALGQLGAGRELCYRDQWGYRRQGRLSHPLEAWAFAGVEPLPRRVLSSLPPGGWAIDVGANVGLVTAQLCRRVGPAGRVWAIEPLPAEAERLEAFRRRNGLAQLTVFRGALSSAAGSVRLRLPENPLLPWATIHPLFPTSQVMEVPAWRLDDLVFPRRDGRAPGFLKIDVEGHERYVLEGAERTLRELRPAVYCEFNDMAQREIGGSSAALLAHFRRLGYAPVGRLPRLDGRLVDLFLVACP